MNRSFSFDNLDVHYIDSNGPVVDAFKVSVSESPIIACDLETTGLDPLNHQISLIGIGVQSSSDRFKAFLFDQLRHDWSELLQPLMEDPSVYKIFHNGKFDWKFLQHQLGIDVHPILDTMQTGQILDNGLLERQEGHYSLGGMADRFLDLKLEKDQNLRTSFNGGPYSEDQLRYAAFDLYAPAMLWNHLEQELDAKLKEIVCLEGSVIPPTGSMELNGFRIDTVSLDLLQHQLEKELQELESGLPIIGSAKSQPDLFNTSDDETRGSRLLVNSPKQIKEFVYEKWKIKLKATDKKSLSKSRHPEARVLFERILNCRELQKKQNTYLSRFRELDDDGRLHGSFHALGTSTGRFSSSSPNLQNIPKSEEYRRLFVPEPGSKMIVCDYSQVELRVAAELAGDTKMIEAFQAGEDLHSMTASRMFGKPLDEINPDERQRAKAVNFGLIYNMQPKRLYEEGISKNLKEAREFVNAFFDLYQNFRTFHRDLIRTVMNQSKKGPVDFRTLRSGRRRWFDHHQLFWPNGGIRPNVVYNTPVQGLAGDGLKQALRMLWPELKQTSAKLLAVVHDEIVLEAPESETSKVLQATENAMIKGMETYLEKVPVKVESVIGESWAGKA